MEDSSNTSAGSQTEESQVTSSSDESTTNSNGNFSGGFDSSALSNDSFSLDSTPDFGIDFGGSKDNDNNSFGFGENLFSDFDFGSSSDSESGSVSGSDEPVMTVDEVYGKGNQSIVEDQGDYAASSNEKSNVETSTLGKQDNISVTPTSVAENKGTVKNDTIQSVEGLDFQQKDKESQEVLDAKKNRDEAEAKDNSNKMRDQLKAVAEKVDEKDAEKINAFHVGNRDEELAAVQKELEQASKVKNDVTTIAQKSDEVLNVVKGNVSKMEAEHEKMKSNVEAGRKYIEDIVSRAKNMADGNFIERATVERSKGFIAFRDDVSQLAESLGIDIGDISKANSKELVNVVNVVAEGANKSLDNALKKSKENVDKANQQLDEAEKHNAELWSKAVEADMSFDALRTKYNDIVKSKFEGAPEKTSVEKEAPAKEAPVKTSVEKEAPTTEAPSYQAKIEATINEINNSKDLSPEQKSEAASVLGNVKTATEAAEKAASDLAANPNDVDLITTYKKANDTLIDALNDAKGNDALKNTDFNRTFAESVVDAINKSTVTMPDGSTKNIAEFMTETVTRSPELAKGLYEAKAKYYADKAKELEDKGEKGIRSTAYKALAAIKTKQSEMAMTWLGSKFTFADNRVRNQFNQLAKTNMRATYAADNNVLNDKTGKYSEAEKAEASAEINQANSLMTASAALKASTGFFSGIGDSTKDGVYGVTNPKDLNTYQKTLNTADNFAKIVLGLCVLPTANKAYQNMYYMAGAKVNKSGLFGRDFDKDGFALCQEYGNNAAVGMITGAGELGAGVALMFDPATFLNGLKLATDSVQTFFDALYGVQKEVNKSIKLSNEILSYFGEAKSIADESGNKEIANAMSTTMDDAIKQIEDFQLKSDEVGNLDNWLEGSGSNTADNGKFNQSLSYDEWLKLIEADPTMRDYAKKLIAEKKNK